MNTTIWKYALSDNPAMPVSSYAILNIPRGAEILTVDMQHGLPVVWARIDPNAEVVRRVFHTMNTGSENLDAVRATYVGTYNATESKSLVFHVFVEQEPGVDNG